ncbi:hypothetical protein HY251_07195, partial [bacterium]|nr:hypothetical protein [bacterium]
GASFASASVGKIASVKFNEKKKDEKKGDDASKKDEKKKDDKDKAEEKLSDEELEKRMTVEEKERKNRSLQAQDSPPREANYVGRERRARNRPVMVLPRVSAGEARLVPPDS